MTRKKKVCCGYIGFKRITRGGKVRFLYGMTKEYAYVLWFGTCIEYLKFVWCA